MKDWLLKTPVGARAYWAMRGGVRPRPIERAAELGELPESGVLQSKGQWAEVIARLRALGLPVYHDGPKNWDSLLALSAILRRTTRQARILDAGADVRAVILPWLARFGYTDLTGINLELGAPFTVGTIRYEHGDITKTRFAAEHFDAITCLSVIEHGVELAAYFREMARLLRPGGLLVTSTDYFDAPIDTAGMTAFGAPVRVFDRAGILAAVEEAARHGLTLTGPLDLACGERAVHWRRLGLEFTFVTLAMQKA